MPAYGCRAALFAVLRSLTSCGLACAQTSAPQHGWHVTRATVEQAFGRPLEVVFDHFGRQPVASGSIAQVRFAAPRPSSAL